MAFSGCSITSGVGKGLVVDTGMSTRSLHCKQWYKLACGFQNFPESRCLSIPYTTNTTSPKIQEKYYIVHMPAAVRLCVVMCRPFSIGVASRKNHHEHCWTFHTSVWAIAGAQAKALDESPNWLMVMPLDYFFGDFRWFQYPVPMSKFHLGKKGLLSQGYWERSHRSSRGRAIYIYRYYIYIIYTV